VTPLSVTGLPLIPMCFRILLSLPKARGPLAGHIEPAALQSSRPPCASGMHVGPGPSDRELAPGPSHSESAASLRAAAPLPEWRPCHWPRRGGPWAMFGRRIQGHWPRRPRCQCQCHWHSGWARAPATGSEWAQALAASAALAA
jgi:hypothetical protein